MNLSELLSRAARIAHTIDENARARSSEGRRNEFEFEAGEQGWSDKEIKTALKSPWLSRWLRGR